MAQKQLESVSTVNKQLAEGRKRKSIQPSSKSAKKVRLDGNLIDAARRIARYSGDDLELINKSRGLSDVPVGTVLEVLSSECKTSVHGEMVVFNCFLDDRRKNPVKVMAPYRLHHEEHTFPAVYAYFVSVTQKAEAAGSFRHWPASRSHGHSCASVSIRSHMSNGSRPYLRTSISTTFSPSSGASGSSRKG